MSASFQKYANKIHEPEYLCLRTACFASVKAIYTCMKISLFISKSLSCAEKEKSNMVDRVFKSKIGWWYHLTVWVMAACTVLTFVKSNNIIGNDFSAFDDVVFYSFDVDNVV